MTSRKAQEFQRIQAEQASYTDTAYNHKYDNIVDNSAQLKGISQMQKSSIGDDFDYNVALEDKVSCYKRGA